MHLLQFSTIILLVIQIYGCNQPSGRKVPAQKPAIRGWNILSDNREKARETIDRAADYGINHLQLSHRIIHDLKHVRRDEDRALARELIDYAHQKGIEEVTVWDHMLYWMGYYADSFKIDTPEGKKINLDNPEFWKWFKSDYRQMLDSLPNLDGIVLTFIETGNYIEDQYSERLKSEPEKLAALVDTLASIIIDERGLSLYLRTFAYSKEELASITKCFELVKNQEVITMMKEVPHDFFLTHPLNPNIQNIKRPVIIEFDATHEYNGQNIIATTFPQKHLERYKYYAQFDHMVGYVIRMDRYGDTHIVNTPGEINAYAIHRAGEDTSITMDEIYRDFIVDNYGEAALENVKKAFELALEINLSTYYTLGTNSTRHSHLDYDNYSIYTRSVSGRWLDPPVVEVAHGVNKTFHVWEDIINHISPPKYKTDSGVLTKESPEVIANNWLQPRELINEEYYRYILTEKEHGIDLADSAYSLILATEGSITDTAAYRKLHDRFHRTLLSARLRKIGAVLYYGKRLWDRGPEFRSEELKSDLQEAIMEGKEVSREFIEYSAPLPVGNYKWREDGYHIRQQIEKLEAELNI